MTDDQQLALGKRIAHQRRALFLTQAALASSIGVTQGAVARWESGDTTPALRHRLRLCQELMISPLVLFPESDDEVAA